MSPSRISGWRISAVVTALVLIAFGILLFSLFGASHGLRIGANGAIPVFRGPYRLGDYKVTMERTGCFGNCPTFTITINPDGSAILETPAESPADNPSQLRTIRIGHKVSSRTRLDIVSTLEREGFRSLAYDYSAMVTDWPGASIGVESTRGNWISHVYVVPCTRAARGWSHEDLERYDIKETVPDVFCNLANKLDVVACDVYQHGRRTLDDSVYLKALWPPACEKKK